MPKQQSTRPRRKKQGKAVWLTVIVVLAAAAAGSVYLMNRPSARAPESPPSTDSAFSPRHIYSETADPNADIAAALAEAKQQGKRVLLDFGGDWCGDCQALDFYFRQPPNAELLQKNFVLVHVWIGQMDTHLDVAAKYGVPISRGVPALAVLNSDGQVLYSQSTGQFADMQHMEASSVTDFLEKWKS